MTGGGLEPDRFVTSRDGAPIAVFESGLREGDRPTLLLVHGTASDHLTFRNVVAAFGRRGHVAAMDRRGRGASGDGPTYAIEREFEDVAAVAEAMAAASDGQVDVVGHSFGGRCGLGASLRTDAIRRLVVYEGAPPAPGVPYQDAGLVPELRALADRGDAEGVLETFFRRVVGFDDAGMARFRADPVWPLRVEGALTIVRELEAEVVPEASLDALGAVTIPVLQVLGTESVASFAAAVEALDGRLAQGSVATIHGAAHAAHHTHPEAFVTAIDTFLDA